MISGVGLNDVEVIPQGLKMVSWKSASSSVSAARETRIPAQSMPVEYLCRVPGSNTSGWMKEDRGGPGAYRERTWCSVRQRSINGEFQVYARPNLISSKRDRGRTGSRSVQVKMTLTRSMRQEDLQSKRVLSFPQYLLPVVLVPN